MPDGTSVDIRSPKGRPMLTWVGKRPLRHVTAFPAQHVETYDPQGDAICGRSVRKHGRRTGPEWAGWPERVPHGGLLYHGDNKEVLAHLLANGFRGKVSLIYIDPPFDSGADYVRKVQLRGVTGTAKIGGEDYTLGEQVQYTDIWANDNYLQFMYERLQIMRQLLGDRGVLCVHCNVDRSHYLKCMLDEVMEAASFRNQIVWQRTAAHGDTHGIGNVHDLLLIYGSGPDVQLRPLHTPYNPSYVESHYTQADPDGRLFQLVDLTAPGPRPGLMYEFHGVWPPAGRVWCMLPDKMQALHDAGRVVFTSEGRPRRKQYLDEMPGTPVHDVWTDVFPVNSQALEAAGYPTQKSEALVDRVLQMASSPGDIVLDCFIGSGTTAAVAQKLGRRWIGCDINKGAIQTTTRRLQGVIEGQIAAERKNGGQTALLDDGQEPAPPAQLSFAVYRVNDYDLQIQHNEAVQLACEHIGVTRSRADAYFDGTMGQRLVKITPFNHPLTLLDLEELRNELKARPEEERDIVVVCLGKEFAVDAWLEDWNRLRREGAVPNRIEVIELRTDPKYGKFFEHRPAQARVAVERKGDKLHVRVEDFVSPTIIERLQQQAGVVRPHIEDWRSMVDSVMIDPAYDGEVFRIALSDVPERKNDLVSGAYELPAPEGETTVAVKITDMLGEEVLVTGRA